MTNKLNLNLQSILSWIIVGAILVFFAAPVFFMIILAVLVVISAVGLYLLVREIFKEVIENKAGASTSERKSSRQTEQIIPPSEDWNMTEVEEAEIE